MIYIPGGARRAERARREQEAHDRYMYEQYGPMVFNTKPVLKSLAWMAALALVALGFHLAGLDEVAGGVGIVAFLSGMFTPMGIPKYPDWQGKDDTRR